MATGKLFVFSAPSGAGKSTLKDKLLVRFPVLRYSVSATTRKPRPGEQEGVHYFFKTPEEFLWALIERRELVEHQEVHGNYYGTPKAAVEKALREGNSVILDLDVYGKRHFDKAYPDAVGVLIVPPSLEVLEARLRARGTDSEDSIQLRLLNARDELAFARDKGKYEYTVINQDFEQALEELTRIMESELALQRAPAR